MALRDDRSCSSAVIRAAMKVHSWLGPGLLESAYEACLAHELRRQGLRVLHQVPVAIDYEGLRLACVYRLDLLVEESVVVELKAVSKLLPVHEAQLLSYLRLTGYPVGLLLNCHELHLRDGLRRRLNKSPTRGLEHLRAPRAPS